MKRFVASLSAGLDRLSCRLNGICWAAASGFLLVMIAAAGLQVIARYVFFSPPPWTEELSRYCMIWAGYLGATVAFYRYEDPVLLARSFTGTSFVSGFFFIVRNVAVLLFVIPIVYWSPVIISHHLIRETEGLGIPSAWVLMIVPIFSSVILIHVSARLLSAMTPSARRELPGPI